MTNIFVSMLKSVLFLVYLIIINNNISKCLKLNNNNIKILLTPDDCITIKI